MRDVVVHFGQQFVQLAGGDVAFHLLIPRVVLPIAKTARDVCALFERQRGNRSLDFSNRAHAGKLSAMRFGVNANSYSPDNMAVFWHNRSINLEVNVKTIVFLVLRHQQHRQ